MSSKTLYQTRAPIQSQSNVPQHRHPSPSVTNSPYLHKRPLSPGRDPVSKRHAGTWKPLVIDISSSNKSKVAPQSLSPMYNGNMNSNGPQRYYPGISVPSIPAPSSNPNAYQQPPAKTWVPLGPNGRANVSRQREPTMWLPPSIPLYGTGVQTTYPGMALAATNRLQSQDPSIAYLSGPWYTLAALGPKSFILDLERERILSYIAAGSHIPARHLWAIIAELYLCKTHHARSSDGSDGAWNGSSMECAFGLSPYLQMAYEVDLHEGDLDTIYDRLERFTDRGSSMWGLKVGPEDRRIWDAMAQEAEAGFDRLAPESKQHICNEWKRYGWDAKRKVVKLVGAEYHGKSNGLNWT